MVVVDKSSTKEENFARETEYYVKACDFPGTSQTLLDRESQNILLYQEFTGRVWEGSARTAI